MSRYLRPFSKNRTGTITVRLRAPERQYLRAMATGFLGHLESDDPALERLAPTVYADPDLESEYQGFTATDLDASRRAAIEEALKTVDDKKISVQTAELWMRTFNDLRLVLGTQLGVDEDWRDEMEADDPRAERYFLYRFLTEVVGSIVYALYEQGNTESRFVFPDGAEEYPGELDEVADKVGAEVGAEEVLEDEENEDDALDDDYDEGDYLDAFDEDDEEEDDDDDELAGLVDEELDELEAIEPDLLDRLHGIETLQDLEALDGGSGLDRHDPEPPEPPTDTDTDGTPHGS
jgi:Domain of unknown function (DUF2017)